MRIFSTPVALPCFLLVISGAYVEQVRAAESGSGLYIGGSQAFGAGVTPPPGFYFTVGGLYYDGDVGAVIDGGVVDLNARKTAFAAVGNALYVWEHGLLGGNLGVSASLPFASFVDLQATASGAIVGGIETSGWGIGDLSLKIQNGWSNGSFSHTASVTMWLPTGRYDTGFSPNAGKNHVGFDLSWGFTKIWENPSLELSGSFGYSIELENPATNYRNGDTFHAEGALGYRMDNGWTLGVAGYAIQQVTGDSGAGASLGDFKRRIFGVGPAIGFSGLVGDRVLSVSARHYQEFGAQNAFQGHITFLTVTTKF